MAVSVYDRINRSSSYATRQPEGYDSKTLAAIKAAFGIEGWMRFLGLVNAKYHAQGGRALVSQVRFDATVELDDNLDTAIRIWLPDGETILTTIPPDFPDYDSKAIESLIPLPPVPILDFTMADNAIWAATVLL